MKVMLSILTLEAKLPVLMIVPSSDRAGNSFVEIPLLLTSTIEFVQTALDDREMISFGDGLKVSVEPCESV